MLLGELGSKLDVLDTFYKKLDVVRCVRCMLDVNRWDRWHQTVGSLYAQRYNFCDENFVLLASNASNTIFC